MTAVVGITVQCRPDTYAADTPRMTVTTSRVKPDGSSETGQTWNHRFDGRGRTVAMTLGEQEGPGRTTFYTYDGLDRVVATSEPLSADGTVRSEMQLAYDAAGQIYRAQADDKLYRYSYSLLGTPRAEHAWTGSTTTRRSTYSYDADQQLSSVTHRTGASTGTRYDFGYENGQLQQVTGTAEGRTAAMFSLTVNEMELPGGAAREGERSSQIGYSPFGISTGMRTPAGSLYQLDWATALAEVEGQDPAATGNAALTDPDEPRPAGLVWTEKPQSGQVFTRRFPDGTVSQQVYDGFGRIAAETDGRGHRTEYTYENNGLRIIKTERPDEQTVVRTVVETTVRGQPLSIQDALGNTNYFTYDSLGRVTKVDAPRDGSMRAVTSYEYDAAGNLTKVTDPRGIATHYTRNELGQVKAIQRGSNTPERFTYNHWGRATSHTNRSGQTTDYEYNDAGRLVRIIYPLEDGEEKRKTKEFVWNEQGRHEMTIDPDQNVTYYGYDARDRLTQVREVGEQESVYEYDGMGRLIYQQDAEGRAVAYQYDALGRLALEDFGGGLYRRYEYDASSNLIKKIDPAVTTTYTYDLLGRKVREEGTDGSWADFAYDAADNKIAETTAAGTTRFAYYPDGRLLSTTDPSGNVTSKVYDAAGNEISGGDQEDAEYDEFNRIKEVVIGGLTYRYEYDADGYVTEIHLPNGLTTHIRYDYRHRIKQQWTDGGGATIAKGEYGYEGRNFRTTAVEDDRRSFAYQYDGRNQMSEVTNWRGDRIRYTYDGAGNLVQREAIIGGEANGETITIDDLMAGILLHIKGQEGEEDGGKPEHPGKGRGKQAVIEVGPALAMGGPVADVGLSRDAKGKGGEKGNAGGNGGGNGHGQGNGQGSGKAPGGGPNAGPDGAKGQGKPSLKGIANALSRGKGKKVGLYRKWAEELGLTGLEANLLSIIDNLVNGEYYLPPGDKEELYAVVREVAAGYTVVGMTYEYNSKNQLTSRHNLVRDELHPYVYDSRGNMLTNGRSRFAYDSENRLTQVLFPDDEGVRFTYDAMGRRLSKTSFNAQEKGEHTTYYEYEGNSWRVARERNKDGEVTAAYQYDQNDRPLTISTGGAMYWYVYNAHGDVVALTDAEGAVKARYEYDEWGRLEAMYDETGRVREGYGTIGDIGTGPARPVIGSETPGTSEWEPGGNGKGKGQGKKGGGDAAALTEPLPESDLAVTEEGELAIQGVIGEPTDLVKANPYRYGGYRYDRETQYYYLRARYYDTRLGRFLSLDTWAGDPRNPVTLNRYLMK